MIGIRKDNTSRISSARKQSAADDAYYSIREMIVSGELHPGQIIKEKDLVRHLDIGRTPVREAIQRLVQQRVVEVFPRRGVAVAKLSLNDVQAVFEARETIEEKTAELAAVRRSEDEAKEMKALGEKIRAVAAHGDYRSFLDADQQLHHLIADASCNWLLAEYADHMLMLSDWIWRQYFQLRGSDPSVYFAHDKIIEAITTQDSECARKLMREHVQQSREIIRQAM